MDNNQKQIDIFAILRRVKSHMRLFVKVSAVVFVVSCALILPVPRTYTSSVVLAPEIGDVMGVNRLSTLASSFGFSLGNSASGDAIYPELYPDLVQSNDFVATLLKTRVRTADGVVDTTYYKYLLSHQKKNPLGAPMRLLAGLFKSKKEPAKTELNTFRLNKEQTGIFNAVNDKVTCGISVKTGVITISAKDQDALVAATMADRARQVLQEFITNYRTSKARVDMEYYRRLVAEAKATYEKARRLYGSYADSNMDVLLTSYSSKKDDLENDMQLKFNNYSALCTQLQNAQARVQERTPAFTVLQGATVPLRPSAPKRMLFVLAMLVLSWMVTLIYVCRDFVKELIVGGDE